MLSRLLFRECEYRAVNQQCGSINNPISREVVEKLEDFYLNE
jgi:hypothetical protein